MDSGFFFRGAVECWWWRLIRFGQMDRQRDDYSKCFGAFLQLSVLHWNYTAVRALFWNCIYLFFALFLSVVVAVVVGVITQTVVQSFWRMLAAWVCSVLNWALFCRTDCYAVSISQHGFLVDCQRWLCRTDSCRHCPTQVSGWPDFAQWTAVCTTLHGCMVDAMLTLHNGLLSVRRYMVVWLMLCWLCTMDCCLYDATWLYGWFHVDFAERTAVSSALHGFLVDLTL